MTMISADILDARIKICNLFERAWNWKLTRKESRSSEKNKKPELQTVNFVWLACAREIRTWSENERQRHGHRENSFVNALLHISHVVSGRGTASRTVYYTKKTEVTVFVLRFFPHLRNVNLYPLLVNSLMSARPIYTYVRYVHEPHRYVRAHMYYIPPSGYRTKWMQQFALTTHPLQ